MSEEIVNKVAQSALLTLDLEELYPGEQTILFDLKPFLFMEMILKEKDFRAAMQNIDWPSYKDRIVAVTCTADAIIPNWAYMLVASALVPCAAAIVMGDEKEALRQVFLDRIAAMDTEPFRDKRVVVKGCGTVPIGGFAYMEITRRLRPIAKSILYGEACSNVPVFKKKQES